MENEAWAAISALAGTAATVAAAWLADKRSRQSRRAEQVESWWDELAVEVKDLRQQVKDISSELHESRLAAVALQVDLERLIMWAEHVLSAWPSGDKNPPTPPHLQTVEKGIRHGKK